MKLEKPNEQLGIIRSAPLGDGNWSEGVSVRSSPSQNSEQANLWANTVGADLVLPETQAQCNTRLTSQNKVTHPATPLLSMTVHVVSKTGTCV